MLILTVVAAVVFVAVLADVMTGGPLTGLDHRVLARTPAPRDDWSTWLADVLARGAHWKVQSSILVLVAMVAGARGRSWRPLGVSLAALGLLGVSCHVLKNWTGRVGPADHLHLHDQVVVPLSATAFPSGHAAGAVVTGLLVAHLLGSRVFPRRRRLLLALGLCWALLVGWSRLRLGVHWTSDVLGGWALGCVALGVVRLAAETLGRTTDQTPSAPH